MEVPLERELRSSLEELGLPQGHWDLIEVFYTSAGGKKLRLSLLESEKENPTKQIANGSYWEASPKRRFDRLARDIQITADQLVFSLAQSHIFLATAVQRDPVSISLKLTCYHLDFGFRLASSGWDRIALMLDLAFSLGKNRHATFATVLKELPKKYADMKDNPHFNSLKSFSELQFKKLEGTDSGIRHEVTHRFSILNSYLDEYEENYERQTVLRVRELEGLHALLLAHYHHYMNGIRNTGMLLELAPPADR